MQSDGLPKTDPWRYAEKPGAKYLAIFTKCEDGAINRNGTDFAANFGFDLASVPVTRLNRIRD